MEFSSVDSTNSEARRLVECGHRGPLWIRADRQDVGRGRSSRYWSSPAGNVYATFLFTPECAAEDLPQLALVVGIAACDVIRAFLEEARSVDPTCQLKWPNDLMIGAAKTGGILVETTTIEHQRVAIIGCGINIAVKPAIDGREVTAMIEYGVAPRPQAFLAQLDGRLYHYLSLWQNGIGFDTIRKAWLERSFQLGTSMSINTGDKLVCGTFAGLAEDGALLMAQSTASHLLRFNFGDVAVGEAASHPDNGDHNRT